MSLGASRAAVCPALAFAAPKAGALLLPANGDTIGVCVPYPHLPQLCSYKDSAACGLARHFPSAPAGDLVRYAVP